MRPLVRTLAAGASGTAALNIVTYADMVVRGRPASDVPSRSARALARLLDLPELDDARATAAGGLLGFADGFAFGTLYAVVAARAELLPWPARGALLGAATIAAEYLAAALGATDPRRWGASGWLATLIPRAAYGLITAVVYESL